MLASKSIRFSIFDLYLGVIFAFPIVTMLADGTIFNRLLFVLLFGLHLVSFFLHPISRKTLLCLLLFILHYIFVFFVTDFPLESSNLLIYFPFFLLYTHFVCDNWEKILIWFQRKKGFVISIIAIWCTLVGVSIFLPSSYYIKEGGSWYFGSFCGSIFRLGPTVMFVQILIIMAQVLYGQKKAVALMVIPLYCVLMGSSRTYLIIGFCLFIISWYIACTSKKVFWGTLIPVAALFVLLVTVSSMGDKIQFTLDENRYGDLWFRITSSRSEFWVELYQAWKKTPGSLKVFGNGIHFSFSIIDAWAHNDFLELLCTFGLLGLFEYVYAMGRLFKRAYGYIRVSTMVKICAFAVWFFNAFLNMHYVYVCSMLSFPFLLLALRCYFKENRVNKWNLSNGR